MPLDNVAVLLRPCGGSSFLRRRTLYPIIDLAGTPHLVRPSAFARTIAKLQKEKVPVLWYNTSG